LEYWEKAEIAKTFSEAVKKHEVCFTKYFFDKGFRYAVYCDTRDYEKDFDIKFNPYIFFVEKLLNEQHCPIIKKRIFYFGRGPYLGETYGTAPRESLKFLKENTNYDVSLILKNILRKLNINTVKADLGLDYIFSENVISNKKVNLKDAAIVAHLYYEDLMPKCIKYLCNTPKEIKLVVTVSTEEKKSIVENLFKEAERDCEVRLVSPHGRDLSALYVGCADLFKEFKYLGFIHDKKSIRKGEAVTAGEEFFCMLWDNFLASEIFIRNTLSAFEEDSHLGILTPPPPYHGRYGTVFFVDRFWSTDLVYNTTLETAEALKIPKKLFDRKIPPLTIGNVFWCRTAALKKITDKDWQIKDFPKEPMPIDGTISHALERILAYAAQTEGFYTGWLMTEDFAKNEIENYLFFAVNNLEVAAANAAAAANAVAAAQAAQEAQSKLVPVPFYPQAPPPVTPHLLFQYFSQLTSIQVLKYYMQSRIPPRFWGIFRPFKKILSKLGFRT
jgi:rhamnosyltransferase